MADGTRWRTAYRALLRLLPPDMRTRFGPQMEDVFRHRLDRAAGSALRTAGVWIGAAWDVVVHAVALRLERPDRHSTDTGRWTMGSIASDARYGLRSLRKAPGFTALAVLTLGLGVGAATATFSVVHAVLLRELPFEEPERLVLVWPEANANKAMTLLAEERMRSVEGVAGMAAWTLTLTGAGDPRELTGLLVSPHYFDILGVRPELGRAFAPDEDLPGLAGVVILSHGLWRDAFGADPDILGRTIDLGGAEYDRRTVIGVMPPGVEDLLEPVDVWVPLEGDRALGLEGDESWYVNERVARLAPGATLEQAEAEVLDYAREVQRALPDMFSAEEATEASVRPVREYVARNVTRALLIALGAAGLVVAIGCFNVANLLLARGEGRGHDLAVRAALGAGHGRLTRMLLAEAALLGIAGGLVGVGSARAFVSVIASLAPETFPSVEALGLDLPVLAFALAVTLASTLAAGVTPALRVGRTDGTAAVVGGARGAGRAGSGRLTPALVGGQIALATVVMVASGLMVRSLGSLLAVDPGLDGHGVLAFKPTPPSGRYPDGEAFRSYYREVAERVAALPGVESVGAIHLLPGTSGNWSFPTFAEGHATPEGAPIPSANFRAVRGDYFATTRIPLVAGRALGDTDNEDTERVAMVNEAFVASFWPGLDPLGRTLRIFSPTATPYRVVGVVADVHQHGQAVTPRPELYLSHEQAPWNQMSMWIVTRVRTGDPLDLAPAVREAVWAVDPDVPISGMGHLADILGDSTRTTRFLTVLLTAFGAFALLLSAVGVFGVATYTGRKRRPEFGVRIALGSSRSSVVRAAAAKSLVPVMGGLVLGLVGASFASRLLTSVLYAVKPSDPLTFVAVTLLLAAIGVSASVLPAWRASRVDPVTVLSSD